MAAWREILVEGTTIEVAAANMSSTSHFELPAGTTAQRPGSPVAGDARYNSDDGKFEYWNGSAWNQGGVSEPDDPTWTGDHIFQGAVDMTPTAPSTDGIKIGGIWGLTTVGNETLSSGVMTYASPVVRMLAESGTEDDLVTITHSNPVTGDVLLIYPQSGDTINVKNTGNISFNGGDIVLSDKDSLWLYWNATASAWMVPGEAFRLTWETDPDLHMEGLRARTPPTATNSPNLSSEACQPIYLWEKHLDFSCTAGQTLNANGIYTVTTGTGGTFANVAGSANGVWYLQTNTDNGDGVGLALACLSSAQAMHDPNYKTIIEGWFRFPSPLPLGYEITFGLSDEDFKHAITNPPTDGIIFNVEPGTNSGRWQGICYNGGISSSTNSTVAPNSTWRRFKITSDGGSNVKFFIDGTQIGSTISTNIPTAQLKFGFWISTFGPGTAIDANVDFFHLLAESSQV